MTENAPLSAAPPAPRRRNRTAQSLTVAIIVLFLLLFLGGLFIALIVNNMRATGRSTQGNAADKLAEAGVKYLDDELTRSPEGADWRPVPFVADAADTDGNGNYDDQDTNANGIRNAEPLRTADPDYEWLRPCSSTGGEEPCGYSRVDFGGRTPSSGNLGGRALVKLIYRPYKKAPNGNLFDDLNGDGAPTPGEWVDSNSNNVVDTNEVDAGAAAASRGLRLLSVGRAGIVDPSDPTTFANSDGKGARRESLAFKQIGTVEFLRHITNKDERPTVAALGSGNKVLDSNYVAAGRDTSAPSARLIESVYHGPIHSNAPLTFYGINKLLFNGQRGDSLTVSANLNIPNNNAQVLLTELGGAFTNANVLASNAAFNSFQGLVRDHAPQTNDPLRRVSKTTAPLIDESIGDNGLTRYRALTRDSQPIEGRFVTANTIGGLGVTQAGRIGWGAGLYLDNREDMQNASEGLLGAYSPRANWVGVDRTWWNGDNRYVPPSVVITLTPRAMIIQRSATSLNRSYLRDNTGRRINQTTVVRYSGLGNGSADAAVPTIGLPASVRKLEGYPAEPYVDPTSNSVVPNVWSGDYVVYAEGNIRIRGTVGGLDPETLRYYIRHLTVVSGGNIYIDGNLLKDNIPDGVVPTAAEQVRGKSSIALLAKNYVVLNTTQFFVPGDNQAGPEASGADAQAIFLNPASPTMNLRLNQAPLQSYNAAGLPNGRVSPTYVPNLYLRHSAAGVDGSTAMRLGVNNDFFRFPSTMAWPNANPALTTLAMGGPTSTEAGVYFDHVFELKDGVNNPTLLYPDTALPYQPGAFPVAGLFGLDNQLTLAVDPSAGVPNQTDYRLSRFGIAPADIRVEALIYAQEGSFFIIPGPWFNPDPNDTYENYLLTQRRSGDNLTSGLGRIDPRFPFFGQPMDIRITLFGAITENLPAEVGDQGAWLEKWGWVPNYYGSTGLPVAPGYASQGATGLLTVHGAHGTNPGPQPGGAGNGGDSGIVYLYDDRLVAPYDTNNRPLRRDLYNNILPAAPRLPVAPGLLYAGEPTGA